MNKFIFMGRLTRDPEIRYSNGNNTAIARFSLAVDRRYKREGEATADFFNMTTFGKSAEFAEKYLKQGTKILCDGRIENGSYTAEDGTKKNVVNYIIENMEFAESKRAQAESAPRQASTQSQSRNDGFMSVPDGLDDEDLPFN